MIASGTELTSYNTFMVLSLISILRFTVSWNISESVNILADFATALGRIQGILEYDSNNILQYLEDTFAKSTDDNYNRTHFARSIDSLGFDEMTKNDAQSHEDSAIVLENVVSSWSGNWNEPGLKSLNLSIDRGDLVFITGRVGAGKSSLLYSILREIPLVSGKTSSVGKIA